MSANISSPCLSPQLFIQSLANIVVVAFRGIRYVRFNCPDPSQQGITFQILNGSRYQLHGKGFGGLTLLKGELIQV